MLHNVRYSRTDAAMYEVKLTDCICRNLVDKSAAVIVAVDYGMMGATMRRVSLQSLYGVLTTIAGCIR